MRPFAEVKPVVRYVPSLGRVWSSNFVAQRGAGGGVWRGLGRPIRPP